MLHATHDFAAVDKMMISRRAAHAIGRRGSAASVAAIYARCLPKSAYEFGRLSRRRSAAKLPPPA